MAIGEDVYCTVSRQSAIPGVEAVLTAKVARNERCISSRYNTPRVMYLCLLESKHQTGAAVLAHSLRDCGTKKKLAVLVTPDTLRPSTLDELRVRTESDNTIVVFVLMLVSRRTSTTMCYPSRD